MSLDAPEPSARRAIVCFVEAGLPYLTQQALALRESLLHVESDDTDLVVMGPPDVLGRFPDDVVRLEQRVVADDPEWFGYRFSNAIACLNGAHAHNLDRYSHILHTDVDTFITPSWNDFRPDGFMCGGGGYGSDAPDVAERIQAVAAELGLTHRGLVNTGATWYGPTSQVRRVGALTEMLTRHILSRHFRTDPGEWPHWYHGVALLYAAEIAINHLVPEAQRTTLLDYSSASPDPISDCVHIHCWHTDDKFSKFAFIDGKYSDRDMEDLDLGFIPDYCMEMSARSLLQLQEITAPT